MKKCSLRGLEKRSDFLFFSYPGDTLPNLAGYVHLKVGAPELNLKDCSKGLLLLDGTWSYAEKMAKVLPKMEERSLPLGFQTAYPRRQEVKEGLSSIEALYLAYHILKKKTEGLLDNYYWEKEFLEKNGQLISRFRPN